MTGNHCREILDQSSHTGKQILLLIFVAWLTGLATFRSLIGSIAAPGIATEMSSSMSDLQSLNIADDIGLALGALLLGWGADRIGRKLILLVSLGLMAAGVLLAAFADNMLLHTVARVTGAFGSGGLLVCATLLMAEYSNLHWRVFCIILVSFFGSLLGAMTGSALMAVIMNSASGEWRHVAYVCTGLLLVSSIVVWGLLPESIHWLSAKNSSDAGDKIKKILLRLGHGDENIAIVSADNRCQEDLFKSVLASNWKMLLALFLTALPLYLLLRGVLAELNQGPVSGFAMMMYWLNLGSIAGMVLFLVLLARMDASKLILWTVVISGVLFLLVAINPLALGTASISLGLIGAFSNAARSGLWALLVVILPTFGRGTGVGIIYLVTNSARVISPMVSTLILGTAFGFFAIWILMGAGSLLAAWLLYRSTNLTIAGLKGISVDDDNM